MAEYSSSSSTTTSMNSNSGILFTFDSTHIDAESGNDETNWDFPDAPQNLTYYKKSPELKSSIDTMAIWTAGKGWTSDIRTRVILEHLKGWGEDNFTQIMQNLIVQKKVFGDAFAEIIYGKDGKTLLNLKPLYPGDMRTVVNNKGIIIRYEKRNRNPAGKGLVTFQPDEILHLCNERVANEIHGTSVVECCKWVIDAKNEAMDTMRKVKRRHLAMGILYVDTDNPTKIAEITQTYATAIKNGEVLVLPKDIAEVKDAGVTEQDFLSWIQYLDSFLYQAVKVPKVIANAADFTEASSKIGYLSFEPIYTNEQTLLEADLYNQLGLIVKFNRPPSIGGFMGESEEANTGQTSVQPNETQATVGRTE